jgi:cadmium resistance protein CadD (predicted permease)
VTPANGRDNINIYTALFASLALPNLLITLVVFFIACDRMVCSWNTTPASRAYCTSSSAVWS